MDVYTEKRKPIIKQPKDTSEPKVKETEVPDSVKDIVAEPAPF